MLKVTLRMPAEADAKKLARSLVDFPSEPSEIYCFRRKCTLDFRVCAGACAARPQIQKW